MIISAQIRGMAVKTTVNIFAWEADLAAAEAVTEDSCKLVTGSSDMTGHAATTPQPSARPVKKQFWTVCDGFEEIT